MKCPSDNCQSTNVEHLPHYWESLPGDSPLKVKYAQPAEVDGQARLVLAVVAVAGVVMLVTGAVGLGLVALAVGVIGAWVAHGRIAAADEARSRWARQKICRACTHLWVP